MRYIWIPPMPSISPGPPTTDTWCWWTTPYPTRTRLTRPGAGWTLLRAMWKRISPGSQWRCRRSGKDSFSSEGTPTFFEPRRTLRSIPWRWEVGGAIGLKAGAAIGTAFAPGIGTAIGAIIGGIGGALLGRKAANAVKSQPLNEARAAYEAAAENYRSTESRVVAKATEEWTVFQSSQKQALEAAAQRIEQKARNGIQDARQRLQQAMVFDNAQAVKLLDTIRQSLVREEEEAGAAYRSFPRWRRWVLPTHETANARSTWRQRRAFLEQWDQEYAQVRAKLRNQNQDFTPEIFDLA